MTIVDLGDQLRITGTWTDSGGTATDPGTITFNYIDPLGTSTSLVYGVDDEVVKSSTGIYYVDLDADTEGTYRWRWIATGSGKSADEGQFEVESINPDIRAGMQNLINLVRTKSNAGTAQYTVGDIVYWNDNHLQDILDRHRIWVVEDRLTWVTQNIAGTARYFTALSSYKYFEEAASGTSNWIVRTDTGTDEGTANYTADYYNGRVIWTADQAGTAYTVTGYSYDIFSAAAEVVREKKAMIDLWYDFSADNQSFSRSQIVDNLDALLDELESQAGSNDKGGLSGNLKTSFYYRVDLNV